MSKRADDAISASNEALKFLSTSLDPLVATNTTWRLDLVLERVLTNNQPATDSRIEVDLKEYDPTTYPEAFRSLPQWAREQINDILEDDMARQYRVDDEEFIYLTAPYNVHTEDCYQVVDYGDGDVGREMLCSDTPRSDFPDGAFSAYNATHGFWENFSMFPDLYLDTTQSEHFTWEATEDRARFDMHRELRESLMTDTDD